MTVLLKRLAPYRWLIAAIIVLIIMRFSLLVIAPPGFYVDEAASGAHAIALLHHGTDAHGQPWPFFTASLGGGYTTPIYLYPLAAWAAVFGPSEYALRAFSMFSTVLACLVLGLAMRRISGSATAGFGAIAAGLALPWGWLQGSLAWDPAMVPLFVALSLWTFSVLLTTTHRHQRLIAAAILPLSLIALAYVYPPCRVTAPLLVIAYYALLFWRQKISLRHLLVVAAASAVLVIPLALFMFQPDALARSQALSVFHGHSLITGLISLVGNFLSLINPLFLFVTGDTNLRHSTSVQGMLGLAAIIPLGALLWMAVKRYPGRALLHQPNPITLLGLVALFGIAASFLGSALTAEGQPHSLRATAAWPFFVILITLGWRVLAQAPERIGRTAIIIAVSATLLYTIDLALLYPRRAATSFDVSQRQAISDHKPIDYPDLAQDYYRWR